MMRLWVAVLSVRLDTRHVMWTNHVVAPNDPTLSCHLLPNRTWSCAHDAVLQRDVDEDDSY